MLVKSERVIKSTPTQRTLYGEIGKVRLACCCIRAYHINERPDKTNNASITHKTGRSSVIVNVKWYSPSRRCIKSMVKVLFFVQNSFPPCLILTYDETYKRPGS